MHNTDRSQIEKFFGVWYGSAELPGEQGIFLPRLRTTSWLNPCNVNFIATFIEQRARYDEVVLNLSLQDSKKAQADYISKKPGNDPYYARGGGDSVVAILGIFIDIDVAGDHSQTALPTSFEEATEFINNLELNGQHIQPGMVVNSGGGLHGYVLLKEPLYIEDKQDQRRAETVIKNVQNFVVAEGKKHGWKLDVNGGLVRTGRIPGTWNLKKKDESENIIPREVKFVSCTEKRYSIEYIESFFEDSSDNLGDLDSDANDDTSETIYDVKSEVDSNKPDFELIKQKCMFVGYSVENAGGLSEGEWFAQMCLSAHCHNGEAVSHEISKPYHGYSFAATQQKIIHALQTPPRTCVNISQFEHCQGCEYQGKITSPVQLGYVGGKAAIEKWKREADEILNQTRAGDKSLYMSPQSIYVWANLALVDPDYYNYAVTQIKEKKLSIQQLKRSVNDKTAELRQQQQPNDSGLRELHQFLSDSPFPQAKIPASYYIRNFDTSQTGICTLHFLSDGSPRYDPIIRVPLIISRRFEDKLINVERVELCWKTDTWHTRIVNREVIANSKKLVELSRYGLPVTAINTGDVIEYLDAYISLNRDILPCEDTASHMGWQDKKGFLVGSELHGEGEITFFSDDEGEQQFANCYGKKGTLREWVKILDRVQHFPAVLGALYASLGSPLLEILEINGFTYELACKTSQGKTTALRFAASCWGNPSEGSAKTLINGWDATRVFIERTASLLGGLPMFLDDTKLCNNPQTLADVIYMIGNGRSKGRGNVTGINAARSIRTILLSTAETPSILATHDGGTRGRALEISIQPFNPKHKMFAITDSRDIDDLNYIAQDNYGHSGPIFIDYLLANEDKWADWRQEWRELQGKFAYNTPAADVSSEKANSAGNEIVGRLSKYAALISLTGRLVHQALQLEWEYNDVMKDLWPIVTQESADPAGDEACMSQLISWVSAHGNHFMKGNGEEIMPYGGWYGRRLNDDKVALDQTVMAEFIRKAGYSDNAILRAWAERGWLYTDPSDKRTFTKQVRFNGGKARMYVIKHEDLKPADSTELF